MIWRAIAAAIISFVALSFVLFWVSLAPWYLFGVNGVLQPGTYDTVPAYNAYALIVSAIAAALIGWLCAAIGRSRLAVIIVAVLCFMGGMLNATMMFKKPEPPPRVGDVSISEAIYHRKEPAWYTLTMPIIGVIGVLIGGRRAGSTPSAPS